MSKLSFKAKIFIRDGNPYILVNKDQISTLKPGWKKPLPVIIQINGKPTPPWHINMMPVGNGDFYLYLHGNVRSASKTKVGDTVNVSIEFDKKYKNGPQHTMPDWFQTALDKHTVAKNNWLALSPSRQKEILRYFSWLKSDEAKQRNIEKVIHVLSGEPGRFMARSWENGS